MTIQNKPLNSRDKGVDVEARFIANGNRFIFGGLLNNGFAEPHEFELLEDSGVIYAEIWSNVLEWNSGTTYNRGDQIIYNYLRYHCIVDDNLNHTPSSNSLWWRGIEQADFNLHGLIDGTGEFYTLNTTTGSGIDGHARIALTPGADDDQLVQHIWAELDGNYNLVLAKGATFPETPIIRLGTAWLPTLAKFITSGATGGQQRYTSALYRQGPLYQGQQNAIMENLRTVLSLKNGALGQIAITINAGARDNVYFSSAIGETMQMWKQIFPVITEQTKMFVLNYPGEAFKEINGLEEIDIDADSNDLRTNTVRYRLNIVGRQDSGTNVISKIGIVLPSGFYSDDSSALTDPNNYDNYDVPNSWKSNSFRIGTAVLRHLTADSGTITNLVGGNDIIDQRPPL